MTTLLGVSDINIFSFLPFLLVPIIFAVVIIVIIVAIVKRSNAASRKRDMDEHRATFTDGNGRTQHQRDYLAQKRVEQSERKARQNQTLHHSHQGTSVEKYDSIVGSLGEVYDEGCYELDGVRLLEHDESYCDDPEHLADVDYTGLQKAIVVGEVINTPRFKQIYGRKR